MMWFSGLAAIGKEKTVLKSWNNFLTSLFILLQFS